MYTWPHVYVFFSSHINNPIGIGFINSNHLRLSFFPMAKPAQRRGGPHTRGITGPVLCTSPHPGAQLPTKSHHPAGENTPRQDTRPVPRRVMALFGFLGVSSSSRAKGAQGQGERQDSQAVRGRGPEHHVGTDPTCPKQHGAKEQRVGVSAHVAPEDPGVGSQPCISAQLPSCV